MKKILVTGGAGFVGSHLCKELINQGHFVICLDNLSTGTYENLKSIVSNDRFLFVKQDVTQPLQFEVDEIYNLACPASPIKYQMNPVETAKASVLGALNVLELARSQKARVLQASTSEIYGDALVHPQQESYWGNVNPIGVRACYDEGKRMAETLFFDYKRQYNTDIVVVRIFNTYGPNMHEEDGRVISNFIVSALKNEPLKIYGEGTQTRSFCYVSDLVNGLILSMEAKEFSGPVNLGNPQECTILDMAKRIIRITGAKSEIEWCELPMDDPKQRKPDISLAKEKLNWQPSVDIIDGLRMTIEYFKRRVE